MTVCVLYSVWTQFSEKRETLSEMLVAEPTGGGVDANASRKRAFRDVSDAASQRQHIATAKYTETELEAAVEAALSLLFSGDRDDCSVDELYEVVCGTRPGSTFVVLTKVACRVSPPLPDDGPDRRQDSRFWS